jgi:hypothetical protein
MPQRSENAAQRADAADKFTNILRFSHLEGQGSYLYFAGDGSPAPAGPPHHQAKATSSKVAMSVSARLAALAGTVLLATPALAAVKLVNPAYGPPGSGRFLGISAGTGTYGVELRGGNGLTNGDWEIGVGRRTSVAGNFTQAQIAWGCVTNNNNAAANRGCGTVLPFTLNWTPTALSITVGSVTTLSPVGAGLAALTGDTLRIWAKRDASFTISEVDGTPFALSATGIASGAPSAASDFYFFSPDNWGGNGLTMKGTVRIAGGRGSANEIFISNGNFVPEPATWAMLIAGFGMVGFAMRRRRVAAAA